jgi:TonB family protein
MRLLSIIGPVCIIGSIVAAGDSTMTLRLASHLSPILALVTCAAGRADSCGAAAYHAVFDGRIFNVSEPSKNQVLNVNNPDELEIVSFEPSYAKRILPNQLLSWKREANSLQYGQAAVTINGKRYTGALRINGRMVMRAFLFQIRQREIYGDSVLVVDSISREVITWCSDNAQALSFAPSAAYVLDQSRAESKGRLVWAQGGDAVHGWYLSRVQSKIENAWRPPVLQGNKEVTLRFAIRANGSISEIAVIISSDNSIFDKLAIRAIQQASPFGKLPRTFRQSQMEITATLRNTAQE